MSTKPRVRERKEERNLERKRGGERREEGVGERRKRKKKREEKGKKAECDLAKVCSNMGISKKNELSSPLWHPVSLDV